MLDTVLLAGVLEGIGREAGTAVSQHVRDPEWQGRERLLEEGHGRGGGLVVLVRQRCTEREARSMAT